MPDGSRFASGCTRFLDEDPNAQEATVKIYVKIEPVNLGFSVLAQVDTGAPWSILMREVAEALTLLDGQGEPVTLNTAYGRIGGYLKRVNITLLADEGGSVEVESTVFVSEEWPAGSFLGYTGMLERVRFAVDPQQNFFTLVLSCNCCSEGLPTFEKRRQWSGISRNHLFLVPNLYMAKTSRKQGA